MGHEPAAPTETEVKFRLEDRGAFEVRLAALGASRGPTEFEANVLLDDAAGTLRRRGVALRLRETGGSSILTFKGPREVDRGVRTRLELETPVGDAATTLALLGQLGFAPIFRYEKRRTAWTFADPARPLVVVDETPIGLFAEIEGTTASVRAAAGELGVAESDFLVESYVGLYFAARERDRSLPFEMVFR